MRTHRVHLDAALHSGTEIELPPDRAHYLRNVLRLKAGDEIVVFDGRGTEMAARIRRLERRQSLVRLGEARPTLPESPLAVTLLQGLARGERMDYTVQKATELGVRRLVPLLSERSEVRLNAERQARRLEHWRAVAVSASEQCGRAWVPDIGEPVSLDALEPVAEGELALVLDPTAGQGLGSRLRPEGPVTLCIGPEGGFSDGEMERLTALGFEGLRLGPRILRTETAGPAALAALQGRWGDLR